MSASEGSDGLDAPVVDRWVVDGPVVDVLSVEGLDAEKFLQSLLSQNVVGMGVGERRFSFLLQPTGKLVGFFAIVRVAPTATDAPEGVASFLLVSDAGVGAAVHETLRRYLIRTKAVLSLQEGTGLSAVTGACGGVSFEDSFGASEHDRVTAGFPRWGRELSDATVPNETGLTGVGVSFTKGCYVGQELVERIDSRGGNVPKRLCVLTFSAEGASSIGDAQLDDLRADLLATDGGPADGATKVVGALTSAARGRDGSLIGLGYVRREVADGDAVAVRWLDPDAGDFGRATVRTSSYAPQ